MENIYVIDYTNGVRTENGPFTAVRFHHINTTVPKAQEDTITYTVYDKNNESSYLTVSIAHIITTEANKTNE